MRDATRRAHLDEPLARGGSLRANGRPAPVREVLLEVHARRERDDPVVAEEEKRIARREGRENRGDRAVGGAERVHDRLARAAVRSGFERVLDLVHDRLVADEEVEALVPDREARTFVRYSARRRACSSCAAKSERPLRMNA